MAESRGSSAQIAPAPSGPDFVLGTDRQASALENAPTQIQRLKAQAAPPVDPATAGRDLFGSTLNHFELLDCIGVGGMGRVFRARDTSLDRVVAIKVLAPELANDPELCRRFEQEAKAAARLDSPHFARVYFHGQDKGLRFIAMEFVEGETLRARIERSGRLDYPSVIGLTIQIARGLEHASKHGVVHRDIKPSNIIIGEEGVAKLLDMGLARTFLQSSPASELTQAGVTLGTFDYISPEQARDPRDVDTRSDIYSLGCTMYHALTGRPPFPDGTALQKLLQHQTDSAVDPRQMAPELPEPVAILLFRMMAKEPKNRYQTAGELIHDLARISQLLDIPLPDEPVEWSGIVSGQPWWQRQFVWLAPLTVLLITVATVDFFSRGEPIPEINPQRIITAARAATSVAEPEPSTRKGLLSPAPDRATQRADQGPTVVEAGQDLGRLLQAARDGDVFVLQGDVYELAVDAAPLRLDKRLRIERDQSQAGLSRLVLRSSERASAKIDAFLQIASDYLELQSVILEIRRPRQASGEFRALSLEQGTLSLVDCAIAIAGDQALPTVAIDAASTTPGRRVKLSARHCYFRAGSNDRLVRLRGDQDSALAFENCAVEQLGRPIEVLTTGSTDVQLTSTTVFIEDEPFFQVGIGATPTISISDSVFHRLSGSKACAAIDVQTGTGDGERRIKWVGAQNLYAGFANALVSFDGAIVEESLAALTKRGIHEIDSIELNDANADGLFETKPTAATLGITSLGKDALASFRLKTNAATISPEDGLPLGVRENAWGSVYSAEALLAFATFRPRANDLVGADASEPLPTKSAPQAIASGVLMVDPSVKVGSMAGVYNSLQSACREASPGSTIEIRTNDVIAEQDIRIEKSLTISAASGFAPRLALATQGMEATSPARLFLVSSNAALHLAGIRLELPGGARPNPLTATLFECDAGASAEIENLWIDLRSGHASDDLAVFRTRVPARMQPGRGMPIAGMPMPANETSLAKVEMRVKRCGIRARGKLLAASPVSYWALSLFDSFVTTSEQAVDIAGPSFYLDQAQRNELQIDQSTLVLDNSLVAIHVVGDQQQDAPRSVNVSANQSAILGAGRQPLNRSIGNYAAYLQEQSIAWEGEQNFVAGYEDLLAFNDSNSMGADEMPVHMSPHKREQWLDYFDLQNAGFVFGRTDLSGSAFARTNVLSRQAPTPTDLQAIGLSASETNFGVPPSFLPTAPSIE